MKKQKNKEIKKIPLLNQDGKKIETLELNGEIFTGKVNNALLYQAILMYRANQRKGSASTKTRANVRGGGKKPWRQKGTGRARFGSIRNPLWRGGGVVFGPHPRDFRYDLPRKLKRKAFISSFNAKLKAGKVAAIEQLGLDKPKTKKIVNMLKALGIKKSVLLLTEKTDKNLVLATRNIKKLALKQAKDVTAYDILSKDHVLITKKATEALEKSVKK